MKKVTDKELRLLCLDAQEKVNKSDYFGNKFMAGFMAASKLFKEINKKADNVNMYYKGGLFPGNDLFKKGVEYCVVIRNWEHEGWAVVSEDYTAYEMPHTYHISDYFQLEPITE